MPHFELFRVAHSKFVLVISMEMQTEKWSWMENLLPVGAAFWRVDFCAINVGVRQSVGDADRERVPVMGSE